MVEPLALAKCPRCYKKYHPNVLFDATCNECTAFLVVSGTIGMELNWQAFSISMEKDL